MNGVSQYLGVFDLLTFSVVCLSFVAVVYLANRRKSEDKLSAAQYILMGRTLTLPMFVGTMVATWYGGIFGVTEMAFKEGVHTFVTQGVLWYLAYIIFAFFIVDKVYHSQAITLPELVKKLFGPRAGWVAGIFNFFNVVPIVYTINLGILIAALSGWSLLVSTIVGCACIAAYSMIGGFKTIVYTDIIQFVIMCVAVALVLFFSIYNYGGLEFLQEKLPDHYFAVNGQGTLLTTLAWGWISLGTLVDPNFYHRCFAANSPQTAKRGILMATVIWCCFDICTVFGSMYAAALMPDIESNMAYLHYAMSVLPTGLKGLFIGGILAAIISTMDSYLFVASNTLSYDLFPKFFCKFKWHRQLGVAIVAALAILLSFSFDGNIKAIWKLFGSLSAGCLLIPVLLGLINRHLVSENAFLASTCGGVLGITYWRIFKPEGFYDYIDDLYIGVFVTLFIILCFYIFSLTTKSPQKTI